ncbi:MAG: OmpA family protein [Tepidanaerobacteraceae bacterium]|nr:OmpA family protein [Tepidanaerobacteraceae bacterium]
MRTLPGSRRRGEGESQPPGSPLWMTTYGDLMTQILIFFALLFALSSVDTKKFDIYISSLQGSLGIIQGGQTLEKGEFIESGEVGQFLVSAEEQRQFERLEQDVKDIIKKNDLSGVQVEMDERGLVIRFVEGVLFDSGKAEIKKQAMAVLDKIVPVLKQSRRQIRVEGHTDNVPIHTREFPSNWELSTARAVNVVRYFIDKHNFSPYTISAAGYGEYRPVAPNDTDKHRALNRRVDIVILKSVSEDEEPE